MAQDPEIYSYIFADIAKKLNNPEIIYTLQTKNKKFDAAPSGISVIDDVLCGGLPRGRITEIFGPEASGKTTVVLHFIAEAQRRGEIVYFIDAEHALDIEYAARIGVNLKTLLFCQPEYGEQALETAMAICDSTIDASEKFNKQIKSLIIIDSVPALVPKQAFDAYQDDKKEGLETTVALGLTAAMLSRLIPPLLSKVSKSNATIVFINQERDNIGVSYGSPTTTPGGRALKFFASLRLKVQRIGYFESSGQKVGIKTQMIPIKSKMFPIFGKRAEFIIGGSGIDMALAMVETLIEKAIAVKKGSWLTIAGESFQGREAIAEEIKTNPEFKKKVIDLINQFGGMVKPLELKPAPNQPPVVEPPKPLATIAPASQAPIVQPTPVMQPAVVQPVTPTHPITQPAPVINQQPALTTATTTQIKKIGG